MATKAKVKVRKKVSTGNKEVPLKVIKGFKTVDENMYSWHDPNFKFEVGKTFKPKGLKLSHYNNASCGVGLHFSPTAEDAKNYAHNQNNYILLEVEAYEKNLIGKDDRKYRVSELKVVKVLEKYCAFEPKALERVNALKGKLLKHNKRATPQKLQALFKIFAKDFNCKNKLYLITNIYEAEFVAGEISSRLLSFGELDLDFRNGAISTTLSTFSPYVHSALEEKTEEIFDDIALAYMEAHALVKTKLSPKKKGTDALLQMLELGCLPLGEINGHYVVYVAQPNDNILPSYYPKPSKKKK